MRVLLKEFQRGGTEMGLYEADWCEFEVHDGVWVQTH